MEHIPVVKAAAVTARIFIHVVISDAERICASWHRRRAASFAARTVRGFTSDPGCQLWLWRWWQVPGGKVAGEGP